MAPPNPDRLRRRIVDLASSGLDTTTFCRATCEVLAAAVAHDYACLATTDPATGLITGSVKSRPGDSMDELLARCEYEVADINQFADLARRPVPVGVLDIDTEGHPDRGRRFRHLLHPLMSLDHELRAVFRADGASWGAIGMYRTGPVGFTPTDVDAVAAVTDTIARGIRASLVTALAAVTAGGGSTGPAVVILGTDDRPRQLMPAAEARIVALGGITHGALPMSLLSIAAAACAPSSDDVPVTASTRVRTCDGDWLVAHAAPLTGPLDAGDVVISIEPAGPPEIVPLIAAGYGLTNREREVTRLVLLGADTAAIAARLHLSSYTVQDHLKSIFAKAGVANRRQLTAAIFFRHYGPRMGGGLGTDGWFAD